MLRMLLNWILSAVLLLVVSRLVPGFRIEGFGAALIAAIVIGFINATLGLVLKIITFPLTIISFGIFLLVVNALMLMLASKVVPGFVVTGFIPAFWGGVILAVLHMVVKWITPKSEEA